MRYGDLFGKLLEIAKSVIIGATQQLAKAWAHQNICIIPYHGGLEQTKEGVLNIEKRVFSPSHHRLGKYICF